MKAYAYTGRNGKHAIIPSMDTSKLPQQDGPWTFFKEVDLSKDHLIGLDPKEALAEIYKDGIFFPKAGVFMNEKQ